jgi:predicted nuclease of predicted toxin-antitoxin system
LIRLLLDTHISGRVVGKALRKDGHDVYALDSEKELEGMEDPDVLELAISEGRVVVTANVGDFMALITELNAGGRSHAGCICVPKSISNEEFGTTIISGVRTTVADTSQEEWIDRVAWIRKKQLGG